MSQHLLVLSHGQVVFTHELAGPLEIGRQQPDEPGPCELLTGQQPARLIVAALQETDIARRQLLAAPLATGEWRLQNLSRTVTLQVVGGALLPPQSEVTLAPPASIALNPRLILTFEQRTAAERLQGLGEATMLPGGSGHGLTGSRSTWQGKLPGVETERLVKSLQTVLDVFQSARTKDELFESAANGAIAVAGFDAARILACEGSVWREVLCRQHVAHASLSPASRHVLWKVHAEKRTFWDTGLDGREPSASLTNVEAVIGAPILSPEGDVLAVLYGDRQQRGWDAQKTITHLDARLMELLACGVASGLARQQQEDLARRMRLQFEQFFTPQLAAELETQPDLLTGRDADVSVLFCDIRGFSRISERIGARRMFGWINDIMETLSECVLRHEGVLIDYIGDELMALWGAPQAQADHAIRACRAAMDMVDALPALNDRWRDEVGEPIDFGIGINSGAVQVGNAGSQRKFKYSPLGNAVNLASRVQGATKYLHSRLLITGATARQLDDTLALRKVCDVRVVNIAEAVPLVEVLALPDQSPLRRTYGLALAAFEQKRFRSAARLLTELLDQFPEDGPTLMLLSRVVQALIHGPEPEHPIWTLPGK